jgi:DNA-binding transcriptional regulator YdaS (Cro superfamily)
MTTTTPLQRAVQAADSAVNLARAIGVTGPMIYQWHRGIKPIGPDACAAIERATGVRCEELRPDLQWVRKRGKIVGHFVPVRTA